MEEVIVFLVPVFAWKQEHCQYISKHNWGAKYATL